MGEVGITASFMHWRSGAVLRCLIKVLMNG